MQIVDTTTSPWELIVPNTRGGDVYRKVIVAAQGGDQVSYDVRLELFGEGDRAYASIRHRHDFEQLRFAVSGRMDLGVAMLNQGQVGYFPANAYSGPLKCQGAVILIAQWGDHFITKADSDRAVAELSRAGKFTGGIYRSAGPDGRPFNKDPLNAIWEQVFGRPYTPQKPQYAQPVVISPDGFGWSRARRPGPGPPPGHLHRERHGHRDARLDRRRHLALPARRRRPAAHPAVHHGRTVHQQRAGLRRLSRPVGRPRRIHHTPRHRRQRTAQGPLPRTIQPHHPHPRRALAARSAIRLGLIHRACSRTGRRRTRRATFPPAPTRTRSNWRCSGC